MNTLARLRWLAGVLWAMSWLELYLEVARFRHVALPAFLGGGSAPVDVGPKAHAGWWLRADLACAAIAPLLFVGLTIVLEYRSRREPQAATRHGAAAFPALTFAGMGVLVLGLGLLNQLVRHPPLVIDLSLRHGNGGFVALGGLCALIGALARISGVTRS